MVDLWVYCYPRYLEALRHTQVELAWTNRSLNVLLQTCIRKLHLQNFIE